MALFIAWLAWYLVCYLLGDDQQLNFGSGAHFVHTLATRYHTLTTDPNAQTTSLAATIYETPNASKESLNLLTLISELFNAGVIGSGLIYDLVRGFLASGNDVEVMGEKEVEGLLKILKCKLACCMS